mgnify:CR=1 FL=1
MNVLINIFLIASVFTFFIFLIANVFNFDGDKSINKIHIDYIRAALIFAIISLILFLINQQTK